MDALTLDRLLDLARIRGGSRVSLYMPTRRFAPGSQEEDSTRLKNLLRTAEDALLARGLKTADAAQMIAPARALVDERPFWLRSELGLAVLLGPEGMQTIRLRAAPAELVRVGDRYHVRPLLPFVASSSAFWLLAISQKRVRLYEGSQSALVEVPADGVPASLAEAMQWDDFEKSSLQFHSGTSGTGGRRPAVFHGTGETEVKDELVRFFREIDRGLHEHLRDSDAPLVIASVDYLVPIYREVNTNSNLADETIVGSPDSITESALHTLALEIIDRLAEAHRRKLAARVEEAWGSSRTTPDPETIVSAARQGRIETLLLADAGSWWGTYDAPADRVSLHPTESDGDEDLLDMAALQTLENGGSVVALEGGEMPRGETAVALLRY